MLNNIFTVEFKHFTPGVKILEFKSNKKISDFTKNKRNTRITRIMTFLEGGNFWGTKSGGRVKFVNI